MKKTLQIFVSFGLGLTLGAALATRLSIWFLNILFEYTINSEIGLKLLSILS
jgi:hypothetical protein